MASELKLKGDTSNVVMRFAPNPNGPPTLGHARGIVVNSELVRKYNGKLILRFDDTDPKTKKPLLEAYSWYVEDCRWLDFNPDKVVECSSNIPEYYKIARQLVELHKAYVCECSQQRFKQCRDGGRACPHRSKTAEENLQLWDKMLSGEYQEGQAVLRIKTDLKESNPALRDWVAFRVLKEKHPKVGSKYNAWPMLDFAGAVEDHLLGVTHIIRGKDLADSGRRQKYLYDHLGWQYPELMHWGRIRVSEEKSGSHSEFGLEQPDVLDIEEQNSLMVGEPESMETHAVDITKLSTSATAKAIEDGLYTGWDDVQLHTLMALRRRGITPEAIRNVMLKLGLSESDVNVSMENLYSENRKILDAEVNRYFFVEDPVEVTLEKVPLKTVRIALHPSFKERGVREQTLKIDKEGETKIHISKKDIEILEKEDKAKLIGLPCIQKKANEKTLRFECLLEKTKAQKIHWVQDHLKAEVLMNDRPSSQPVRGYCEKACEKLKAGETVQFERFGFCRLDEKQKDKLVFCYGHQ